MILKQCVDAYVALTALEGREMDFQTAHALVEVKRALQPQADFFFDAQNKLIAQYGEKDEKGSLVETAPGQFKLAEETAQEFIRRNHELGHVEAEVDLPEVKIKAPEKITPKQVEALEGIVTFE